MRDAARAFLPASLERGRAWGFGINLYYGEPVPLAIAALCASAYALERGAYRTAAALAVRSMNPAATRSFERACSMTAFTCGIRRSPRAAAV